MAGWVSSYHYGGHTYNRGDALVLNGSYYYDITDPTPNGTLNNETRYFYGVFVFDDGSLPLNPVGISNAQAATSPSGGTIRFETIVSGGTPDTFTYSFDANGGSGAPSAMTKTYGVHFTFPSKKPIKEGNTFLGWYNPDVNNGKVYLSGTQYIGLPDKNIIWYAKWAANEYTVTYNPNGGTGSDETQEVVYGTSWTSKGAIFSKTGYTQTSWNTKPDGSGVTYSLNKAQTNAQLSNLTLYAIWKANDYTITLNANGGSISSDKTKITVTYRTGNYNVINDRTPTLEGHSFDGWYTEKNGGSKVYDASGKAVNGTYWDGTANSAYWNYAGNVTLYAQWTVNSYKLTINPNGGRWNGSTSEQAFTQKYGSEKEISEPTRVGYDFAGWELNGYGSLSGTMYTYGAGNGTLTAKWTRIVLTVTFDAETNGGTPNGTKDVNYGDAVGALPIPEKPYYKFIGWFTENVGGTQVESSQIITSNVTYYAQFKIDASVKVLYENKKYPSIVWIKVDNLWRRCLAWVKQDDKWLKSTGA